MQTHEVRRKFLDYFKAGRHVVIPSSPVVPHDDPTLLFTNAGMNQFKDVFLGTTVRDYTRAATSQKCIRVGGKHNDLDNVGHTQRHLTFFEMLGNFSFGDYFKKEAIEYAWQVSTEIFGFDPDYLWISIFREDDESFELWKKHISENRIVRMDEEDNFWVMGEVGPCGPCSELYYDKGEAFGSAQSPKEDPSGRRYLEYWNLVFMQYNKDAAGAFHPLPKPSIDTGSGIERVMSLIQQKESVFETDVLRALIAQVESLSGIPYDPAHNQAPAFHVIADHLRTLAFAIADGAQPSNVDRGYVLRKVLRRAVRYGKLLRFEEPFLAHVLPSLVGLMGGDYKELTTSHTRIAEILTKEEEAFFKTLKRGGNMLGQVIEQSKNRSQISGDDAFKLKDTYGLPLEEIRLIAKDHALTVDEQRFTELELEAKEKSKNAREIMQQAVATNLFEEFAQMHGPSTFSYHQKTVHTKIYGLIHKGMFTQKLDEGMEGIVLLKETPFYAEMGGQVGDTGIIESGEALFEVENCLTPFKGITAHIGRVKKGIIVLGSDAIAKIDTARRQKIANNHTATHLLHWALHKVLGEHIKQAGSVVDDERLRFDFYHHKPLTEQEILAIEESVNEAIRENREVANYEIPYEEAQKREDIKQFFGEKYGTIVRVVDIDFSKELCGGTHTSHTGNIGYFRIAKESGIAAGVRRIEALTGAAACDLAYTAEKQLRQIAERIKSPLPTLLERIAKMQEEIKELQGQIKESKKRELAKIAHDLPRKKKKVHYCIVQVSSRIDELPLLADAVAVTMPSGIIALGTTDATKAHILVRVSDDLTQQGFCAEELLATILPTIAGKGGGKNSHAQGAGMRKEKLGDALEQLAAQLE